MNKIYITGDTHGDNDLHKLTSICFPEGKSLTKSDYVIICGDFGLLWKDTPDKHEQYLINWYNSKPWTTLFVDGNHENFNRLNSLPIVNMFNANVGKISDSIFHLKRSQIYTINNKTFFTMGGAKSIDKQNRIENLSWWKHEIPNYSEFDAAISNLANVNNEVDYIIGHTAPLSICNKLIEILKFRELAEKNDAVEQFFEHIISYVKFKKFYCGHWHIDYVIDNCQFLYELVMEIE